VTVRTFDAVLRKKSDGGWTSEALTLPKARVAAVLSAKGDSLPFDPKQGTISVAKGAAPLYARIELPAELIEASTLDQAKVALERDKLAVEERAGRRTLLVSVVTAIVSAAAALGVALITNLGGSPSPHPIAPTAYKDLVDCRESLNTLASLANLNQQSLQSLKEAVGRHVEACRDRLSTAIAASQP
jgi:hypothetical protein